MIFKEKVLAVLGSIRFWQIILIAIVEGLIAVGVVDGAGAERIARIIELVLGSSVTLGTIDSAATKLGTAVAGLKK